MSDRMNDHTVSPDPRTIIEDGGMHIGDYAAKCAYCGGWISGNENNAIHLDEDEAYFIGLTEEVSGFVSK